MDNNQPAKFERDITPKVLQLYLELAQYPILGRRILQRMRDEIFSRGVIDPKTFEEEVRQKALQSQKLEGLENPFEQESADIWAERVEKIAELVTVFYFAHNLPHTLFEDIVAGFIGGSVVDGRVPLSFNPELAPWSLLFDQGEIYESYSPEDQHLVKHHLQEIRAVLIKTLISDHLTFIKVAREYFTIADLREIRSRRIGRGKIGGKSAGMLLAYKILQEEGAKHGLDIEGMVTIPDSYYIAADAYYDFKAENGMYMTMNQKYKSPEQIKEDHEQIRELYLQAQLPDYVLERLQLLVDQVGQSPLIVRSSSLLEDNFDTSFAGKYDSVFVPNQGTSEENFKALQEAILYVYASVLSPDALIYRQRMGLIDYDERMGILIQKVEGERYGDYFFPAFAGVGFGHNPYQWSKRIRPEDGLLRLVSGLGTRAVDRVGKDYPRMVALSHPTLRPEGNTSMQRQYSQHYMDIIDLAKNEYTTRLMTEILEPDYPGLNAIISVDKGGYLQPIKGLPLSLQPNQMVITFDRFLNEGVFVELMRKSMKILGEAYGRPVDMEFAGRIIQTRPEIKFHLSLLQCRPQSRRGEDKPAEMPDYIPESEILFTATQQVPQGCVEGIRYIVYVDPRQYMQLPDNTTRFEIGHVVGRINGMLEDKPYILMGPGRWGTSNIQLGVKVTYTEIYNTRMLIEIAFEEDGTTQEVSYGTHFFQDLVESNIYPLPLYPSEEGVIFREDFFRRSPNMLCELMEGCDDYEDVVHVIDVPAVSDGKTLTVIMNSEENKAIAYLTNAHAAEVKQGDSGVQ